MNELFSIEFYEKLINIDLSIIDTLLGIVVVAKDTYGFIMSSSRNENIFYHNGELKDIPSLKLGDIISFKIGKSEKRLGEDCAVAIELLERNENVLSLEKHDLLKYLENFQTFKQVKSQYKYGTIIL